MHTIRHFLKFFWFFTFALVLVTLLPVRSEANDDNPFSLLVSLSGSGSNYIKVTGFLPDHYDAKYFGLGIKAYKDHFLIEQKSIPLRSTPVFNIEVKARLNYEFVMQAYDSQEQLIIESERLFDISGAKYLGKCDVKYNVVSEEPSRLLGLQASGLNIVVDDIRCSQFPHINAFVGVQRDDQFVENLTEQNFTLFEDGLVPATGITVVPPDSGGGVRLADFAFVFDHSGSMDDDLSRMRNAIGDFTTNLDQSDIDYNLAFVPYERSPRIEQILPLSLRPS